MSGNPPGRIHPYRAKPVVVLADADARPKEVGGDPVASIREEWLVEDSWWSHHRISRHYFEVVLEGGRNLTLFRSLPGGEWFSQRA